MVILLVVGSLAIFISMNGVESSMKAYLGPTIYSGTQILFAFTISLTTGCSNCLFLQFGPTQFEERIRGMSIGMSVFFGSLISGLSVQIAALSDEYQINGLGMSCMPALIAIILLIWIK